MFRVHSWRRLGGRRDDRMMWGGGPNRIELIDDSPVSERQTPHRTRPRVVVAIAVLAVVSAIAVIAAPWDSGSNARTPTTSTTTSTIAAQTSAAPTTFNGQLTASAARMVGVLPDGLVPFTANTFNGHQDTARGGQLWADDRQPADHRPWFILTTTTTDTPFAGTLRLATPVGVAVVRLSAAGDLTIGPVPGGQLALQSSGLDVEQLERTMAAMTIVDGQLTIDHATAPSGFDLVTAAEPDASLAWSPFVTTGARSAAGRPVADLTVNIGPPLDDAQHTAEQFFTTNEAPITVNGVQATIGTDTRSRRRTIRLERNGLHVVVAGQGIDDHTLTNYAASLRTVDDDAWSALQRQAASAPPLLTNTRSGRLTHLTGASLNNNAAWDIRVGRTPTGIAVETLENRPDGPGAANDTELPGTGPAITATSLPSLTAIVAAVPASTTGAVLRVHTPADTIDTPFAPNPTIDIGDALLATTTFTEPGNYTAEIMASDGTTLARLDPTTAPAE
jgi:hypothetical protein